MYPVYCKFSKSKSFLVFFFIDKRLFLFLLFSMQILLRIYLIQIIYFMQDSSGNLALIIMVVYARDSLSVLVK